ncbi:MAG: aspartate aminotransferase family protein [Chitinophagaceae bacterium]|nr:aspartate aminotransferase family protein [Chitinophagaceae bacterium]
MNIRQQFFKHIAQTSPEPIGLDMVKAEGIYMFDVDGKKYIDGISGFSVANIGHSHPKIVEAVQTQAAAYMHLIVYGEFIEQPQVAYAKLLTDHLPENLNSVYFTNSGAEAVEGAMKLAKRVTNRSKIICFNQSYHGSTQGALSLMGSEYWRQAYRPLLPDVYHYNFNSDEAFEAIDNTTACVILEPVQAEAGILKANAKWLSSIREKCNQHCTLLIFDEIQTGFGRTGSLWAFEQLNVIPDVLLLGKALGGGMPLGAFISSQKMMSTLSYNPVLGHITTFGGHPVSCAAGKAALEVLLENNWINEIKQKEKILQEKLNHSKIKNVNIAGLWAAVELESFEVVKSVAKICIQKGLITDWFLFADSSLRIAPPLIITIEELNLVCEIVIKSIDEFYKA